MVLKKVKTKKLTIQRKIKLNLFLKKRKKIFLFKENQKKSLFKNKFVETLSKYKINRRLANKYFFYRYKSSHKRLKNRFYVNKDIKNKKVVFCDKRENKKLIFKENEPDYWLFIKPTINNLFVYIYNIDVLRQKSLLKKRKFFKKKI